MKKWGHDQAVDLLHQLDPEHQKRLLKLMAQNDPKTAERLQKDLFVFEDILKVNPKGITELVAAVKIDIWSLALRKASSDLKKYIFANISKRRAESMVDYFKTDGPKPLSQVQAAQLEIVEKVLELEAQGRLAITRLKDSDPLV